MPPHRRALLLTALLVLPTPALADTVAVPATRDTTIYDDPAGMLANGAGDSFFTGLTGEPRVVRSLIEFDVASAVPAGATITNATLTLHMAQASMVNPFDPHTVSVHRALAEWGEGTSHAPMNEGQGTAPTAGDATWLHTFYPTDLWATPGGDFAAASASLLVPTTAGFNAWTSPGLASDVQLFLDSPADNHGWMLTGAEGANARRFDSRTSPTISNRPVLEIEYTSAVAVPLSGVWARLALLVFGGALVLRARLARGIASLQAELCGQASSGS